MQRGRLFWKFFFCFWLAQLLTAVVVGAIVWVIRNHEFEEWRANQNQSEAHGEPAVIPNPNLTPYPYPNPFPRIPRSLGYPTLHPQPFPHPPHNVLGTRSLLPLTAGSIISLIFAWLLARYFAQPIRTLRQAFKNEAEGKLETRIGKTMAKRRDELADLGDDFDHMAERLESLVEGQRRLLHDVSHELRSPLARLQAATDLMQQQPERSGELIERLQRDTDRINQLVGELLTIARLDDGKGNYTLEPLNLNELLEDLGEDALFEATTHNCNFELQLLSESMMVNGNAELLRRAIENVCRNAIRHTPPAGKVLLSTEMTVLEHKRAVKLSIIDNGSGVDENDLQAIFSPFYRAKHAKGMEGYGLGLTIARQIVKLHNGSIEAQNRPDGFAIIMLLPLLTVASSS